tara:strand:+ start:1654 stop:2067 length:414 start_codon:yes stop_codon:yes gene_type:complete
LFTISNKAKYALATMVELALSVKNKPVQAKLLSNQCQIPIKFLEHILSDLRQAGLILSQRGSKGGYCLAKTSDSIAIIDIITVIDGPLSLSLGYCGGNILNQWWKSVEVCLQDVLLVSLSELVVKKQKEEKVINYAI